MAWLAGIGLAVILLIVLILITKIHVTVHYHHQQDDDSLTIRFRAWGITVYTYEVPMIAFDEESSSILLKQKKKTANVKQKSEKKVTKDDILARIEKFRRLLKNIDNLHRIVKRFLSRMTVSRFEWYTRFGIGDAAWTGMATGAVWAAKGNVIGLIAHYMRLAAEPDISVEPVWQLDHSETDLSCMISFRIGHAMGAGLKIVKYL